METDVASAWENMPCQSENIDDPCRETELRAMYNYISTQVWYKAKDKIFYTSQRSQAEQRCKGAKSIIQVRSICQRLLYIYLCKLQC